MNIGNVDGIPPEKSIADAYKRLRTSVYNNTLVLNRFGDKVSEICFLKQRPFLINLQDKIFHS
jgi:hypothetical protein